MAACSSKAIRPAPTSKTAAVAQSHAAGSMAPKRLWIRSVIVCHMAQLLHQTITKTGVRVARFRLLDSGGVKWHQPPATVNGQSAPGSDK
jgi:hypothetical protein